MIIHKIIINNFASISHLEFDFLSGTVLILSGANGSGKSTLLDAIFWCMYGTSRSGNVNISPFKNPKAKSSVTLVFFENDKEITFTRKLKGSPAVTVFIDKVNSTNAESANYFSSKMSKEMFLSLCFISKQTFSLLSNTQKKDLIQSIFQFYDLEKSQKKAKDAYNIENRNLQNLNREVFEATASITELKNIVRLVEDDVKKSQESILADISDCDEDLANSIIKSLTEENKNISIKYTETCASCGQNLPLSDQDLKIIHNNEERIYFYRNQLGKVEKLKKRLSSTITIDNSVYIESTKKIALQENKLVELNNKILETELILKKIQFWVDGFSNTGIANMVLSKMLETVSYVASEFSASIGFTIFIENQSEKVGGGFKDIISIKVNDKPIEALSSGEKKRVDLCILSALRLIYSKCFPILILDETFDSLDEEGCPFVLNMLNDLAKKQNIIVLLTSHLQEIKNYSSDQEFKFVDVSKVDDVSEYKIN